MSRSVVAIALMAVLVSSGVAVAGERTPLRVGEALPDLEFMDIEAEPIGREVYRGWVQVLTFADRKSSEELESWLADAQIRAAQAHPELPVVYLGLADVSAVPRLLRRVVRPLLHRSSEKSNEEMAQSYRRAGIDPDPAKLAFRFVPDWDGNYLEAFGLENAATYHCWVVVDGRVVAAFDASTPNIADRYVEAFDRLSAEAKAPRKAP